MLRATSPGGGYGSKQKIGSLQLSSKVPAQRCEGLKDQHPPSPNGCWQVSLVGYSVWLFFFLQCFADIFYREVVSGMSHLFWSFVELDIFA